MVIYKLGIKGNKNFDLSNIIEMDFKNSLRIIDEITSNFDNEKELKEYLLRKNIIDYEKHYENINICINYQHNRVCKILPVIYKKEKTYLNSAIIINKIYSLIYNKEFIKKLIDFYDYNSNYNPQIGNISNLELYLSDLIRCGKKALVYDRELIDYTLNNLVRLATHKYDKKTNSYKYNYRGLRDLALFIYNFEFKEELKEIKESLIDNESNIQDKWVLSSEGDPDFPPNSEEEKMYLLLEEENIKEYEKRLEEERRDL